MFLKNYHLVFLTSLTVGTIIAISSNSWFTCWVGLEINLIRIIPLILIKLSKNLTEVAIKYFLTQAIASLILIFSISINFLFSENNILEIIEIFIACSLTLKRGIAPFHFWFPQISNLLNWTQCLILFTWQKIAPLLLIFSLRTKIIFFIRIISSLTGALGGLNQNLAKTLIAYSSITHRGWILLGCSLRISCWINYFLIYSFISFIILSYFFSNQIIFSNQIFNSSESRYNKNIMTINFLSLGGLPPLLGFFAKISILLISIKIKIWLILIPLILSSLISLFFYTRLIYSSFIISSKIFFGQKKINKSPKNLLFTLRIIFNLTIPALFLLN